MTEYEGLTMIAHSNVLTQCYADDLLDLLAEVKQLREGIEKAFEASGGNIKPIIHPLTKLSATQGILKEMIE